MTDDAAAAPILAAQRALRTAYLAGDAEVCGAHHHNLSIHLEGAGVSVPEYLAQCLAAGVLFFQAGSDWLMSSVADLAAAFAEFYPRPPFPDSFDQLCQAVEAMEGVHFRSLVDSLAAGGGADGDEAMHAVLGMARRMAQGR